jgi:hypothetical protein
MGQYHTISCPQTGTAMDTSDLGAGIKALEIIWSDTSRIALALLLKTGFEDHSRDLSWIPTGIWAGKHVLATGDYVENGDLRNAPFKGKEEDFQSCNGDISLNGRLTPRKVHKNISHNLVPYIERICSLRATDLDENGNVIQGSGWRDFAMVKQTSDGWTLSTQSEQEKDYYERTNSKTNTGKHTFERGPVCLTDPNIVDSPILSKEEVGTGGRPLWISIDRKEYIDPQKFGEFDLVDVINGKSGISVIASLFHHDVRGGGDAKDLGHVSFAARWRGDRMALIGPKGLKIRGLRVTQEEVLTTYTDVTDIALLYTKAIDHHNTKAAYTEEAPRTAGTDVQSKLLSILIKDENFQKDILNNKFTCVVYPYITFEDTTGVYTLPGSVKIYSENKQQKYFINPDLEIKLKDFVKTHFPQEKMKVKRQKSDTDFETNTCHTFEWIIETKSAHDTIRALTS